MKNIISYDVISLMFSLGCLPLLFLTSLPTILFWYCFFILALVFILLSLLRQLRYLQMIGFLLIGFLWSTDSAINYIKSVMSYIDQKLAVMAEVKSVNISANSTDIKQKYPYILFDIQSIDQYSLQSPLTISLLWREDNLPSAGQRWQLNIKTKVIHSYLNQGSFDAQRFAIANRRLLSGSIEKAKLVGDDFNLRQRIISNTLCFFDGFKYQDIMLALAFGERSLLTSENKTVMFQTGIAHLMAISGMHITLVFLLGRQLGRLLQLCLPLKLINFWMPLLIGWGCAVFYAWLSGFNPPVMRAVLALSLYLLLRYRHMQLSAWQIINRIISILLIIDPLMILSESFWLSCYAVICLVFIAQWVPLNIKWKRGKKNYFLQLIYLQIVLSITLLPIQLFIFNGTSQYSIIANLIAIPLISLITFPLILLSLVMLVCKVTLLATGLMSIADYSLIGLFYLLTPLTEGWLTISSQFYLLGLSGWLAIIVWRTGLWYRYVITIILILLILLSPIFKRDHSLWRIHMLDVGHGLAVVIQSGHSAVIYDTGAKWQNSSAAERIIIPFLKWHNIELEGIIISHQHNDHIGGLAILQQYYPNAWLMSSAKDLANHYECTLGQKLQWRNLQFVALWPNYLVDFAENPDSCVVHVSNQYHSILLTGDLEKEQENQLVIKFGASLKSTVLQIPHHGSNTSSYYPLLSNVNPDISLASISRYNLWRLPSKKALQRYHQLNLNYHLTSLSGQISVIFHEDSWQIETMRNKIKPRWYHDWFGALPNYE